MVNGRYEGQWPHRFEVDGTLGIQVFGSDWGDPSALSGTSDPDLRGGGRCDPERGGIQEPHTYACGIPSFSKYQ